MEVSDGAKWRDLTTKAPLYAAAGLAELWVVDVEDRMTHVRRGRTPKGWEQEWSVPLAETLAPAAFPDWAITIDALS